MGTGRPRDEFLRGSRVPRYRRPPDRPALFPQCPDGYLARLFSLLRSSPPAPHKFFPEHWRAMHCLAAVQCAIPSNREVLIVDSLLLRKAGVLVS